MEQKENNRSKCPVCGRFCKAEAVDRYNGLLSERDRLVENIDRVSVELGTVRKSLVEAQEDMKKAITDSANYESLYIDTRNKLDKAYSDNEGLKNRLTDAGMKLVAMQSEMNDLRAENERLRNRSFFARLFNK